MLQRLRGSVGLWGPLHNARPRCLCFAAAVSAGIGEPQGRRTTAKNIRAPVRQECTHARSDASFLHAVIASDLAQSAILSPALTR